MNAHQENRKQLRNWKSNQVKTDEKEMNWSKLMKGPGIPRNGMSGNARKWNENTNGTKIVMKWTELNQKELEWNENGHEKTWINTKAEWKVEWNDVK